MTEGVPLGPFRLERMIGVGGAGEVWRGVHSARGVPVAVKVITAARARDVNYVAAFADEVRSVAGLSHPGVVLVFDTGTVDADAAAAAEGRLVEGSPYLAMELASSSWRTAARPTSWRQLRAQLLWLLDVLAHAHAHGVIHRDLKPGNVLVFDEPAVRGDDEGASRLRLTDFGLAYAAERAQRAVRGTSGTPRFMAPEQFLGQWRDFGPPTDLYALGCLAFAMAVGRAPFLGRGMGELKTAHVQHAPPALEPEFPVPAGLQGWIWRLLQKDPGRRFQRAADAAWALLDLGDVQPGAPSTVVPTPLDDEATAVGHALTPSFREHRSERPAPPRDRAGRSSSPLVDRSLPPLPGHWRQRVAPPSPRLVGAGLGLYGLRRVPLVGRGSERDTMWSALRACREDGQNRAVVLGGAAGTGKSRLAEWIARRADEVGAAVVVHGVASAEGAGAEGLARLVTGAVGAAGLEPDALEARLSDFLVRRGQRDPYVARGLTALVWPGHGGVRFAAAAERHALVAQLLDALVAYQDDGGRLRPVVLWLDDVHHSPDLLALVRHLLGRRSGPPVLALLTVRDEALAADASATAAVDALDELPAVERVQLRPLSEAERAELVQRLLMLEGDLARQVEERTGGNPLFAVQLVGDWVSRGVLEVGDRGFVLAPGESARLPDDIHELWTARLSRLRDGDAGVRPVLELAALLGQAVLDDEWRDACDRAGLPVPAGLVGELLGVRLALSEPEGWSFAHGMLRESLERSAAESGRATRLHDACAAMLVTRRASGAPDLEARLARHLVGCGRLEEAVEPLRRAVAARRAQSDYPGALAALDRREDVLTALGVSETDPRWGEGWTERAAVCVGMGRLDEAEALARRVIGTSGEGWPALWPAALRHAATALAKRGRLGPADELLRRGEQAAEQEGDEVERARCALFLGDISRLMGRWDEAEARCREARARFEALGDVRGQADALAGLAGAATSGGDPEAAEAWAREAIPLYEQAGARFGLASAQNSLGDALRARGELGPAEVAYREAEAELRRLGSPEAHVPRVNLGFVLLARGRYREARAFLEPVLGLMMQLQRRGMEGALHVALLPCVADAGEWEAFEAHVDAASQLLGGSGLVDPDIAETAELGAELALAASADALAARALELAREQWRQLGDRERLDAVEQHLARRGLTDESLM